MIDGIDHVAITMPVGSEPAALTYFRDLLELPELEKPDSLKHKGGVWFALPAGVQLHLQAEAAHLGAKRAHPALATSNIEEIESRLRSGGYSTEWDTALAPRKRFYTQDPFGNRLEFIEKQ
ncbi:MAG TPA: VOC family protein [Fimbriimonadaceae bacterium]|jgi:catechol 2,3-dioxygenase-like lactoylglutathione lyase family enzyme